MIRPCDACRAPYEALRPSSRYCCAACRQRAHRGAYGPPEPHMADSGPVAVAVRADLVAVGRDSSVLAAVALGLADKLDSSGGGSAFAAACRELRTVMTRALAGAEVAADPVDDLRARRSRKGWRP